MKRDSLLKFRNIRGTWSRAERRCNTISTKLRKLYLASISDFRSGRYMLVHQFKFWIDWYINWLTNWIFFYLYAPLWQRFSSKLLFQLSVSQEREREKERERVHRCNPTSAAGMQAQPAFILPMSISIKPYRRYFKILLAAANSTDPGPEVIKLLNSTEDDIFPAHKC